MGASAMFTGIIQMTGHIARMEARGRECRLTVRPHGEIPHIVDGESIAVNGVCLSVEHHLGSIFSVYASGETMGRTSLGRLSAESLVNLERALAVGDRLGGHIVSGHVDCLAVVQSVTAAGDSLVCRFGFPRRYAPEVVAKGSVTLDGISLTVNEAGEDYFTVNIIPDTQARTTMRLWKPGCAVNMETDIIGKYVRHLVAGGHVPPRATGEAACPSPAGGEAPSGVTRALLAENGFL